MSSEPKRKLRKQKGKKQNKRSTLMLLLRRKTEAVTGSMTGIGRLLTVRRSRQRHITITQIT